MAKMLWSHRPDRGAITSRPGSPTSLRSEGHNRPQMYIMCLKSHALLRNPRGASAGVTDAVAEELSAAPVHAPPRQACPQRTPTAEGIGRFAGSHRRMRRAEVSESGTKPYCVSSPDSLKRRSVTPVRVGGLPRSRSLRASPRPRRQGSVLPSSARKVPQGCRAR